MDFISTIHGDVDNIFCLNTDDFSNNGTFSDAGDSNDNIFRNIVYYSAIGRGAAYAVSGGIIPGTQVRKLRIENVDIICAPVSTRLLSGYSSDGGDDYHNIQFNNIRMEEISQIADYQDAFYCKMSSFGGPVNQINNITYDHYWLPGMGTSGNKHFGHDSLHMIKKIIFNKFYLNGNLVTGFENGGFRNGHVFTDSISFTNAEKNLINVTASTHYLQQGQFGYFRIERTGPLDKSFIVRYRLRGNAKQNLHYSFSSDSIVIPEEKAYSDLFIYHEAGYSADHLKQVILVLKHGDNYLIDKNYIATINLGPEMVSSHKEDIDHHPYTILFPNPAITFSNLSYQVPEDCKVNICLYNSKGVKVNDLLNEYQSSGEYNLRFNFSFLDYGTYIL
jgi:hypothetical protein